ncbi:hypothetical protein NDQ53_14340 [Rossellomorea marisflavi]|uniref:hypothetical protein n=1 Tax=Rossellomorea marisflavi TaxID=189381 RepID=UPI00203F6F08|nr:hypothetical protein [Rossellomorea marisflavi]MCM2590478.1 hypothetical protein [Rossellomorea marisflavi]
MAIITEEDLNQKELLHEKLKSNNQELEALTHKRDRLIHEQSGLLLSKLEEMHPIMESLQTNRYGFTHLSINFITSRGPILDYYMESDYLYVYDFKEKQIKRFNIENSEKALTIPAWKFIEVANLKNVSEGLNHLLTIQNKMIHELKNSNQKRLNWIDEIK